MNVQSFVTCLKECESANGAGKKAVIRDALARLDETGRKLMRYTMNPYQVFGIKKFDCLDAPYADVDPDATVLFEVLDKLESRELTGDAARNAWADVIQSFTSDTAEYIERIVDKDPRGGFSEDTFNKVWPNDPIPTFKVMLADKCDSTEEFEKHVTFPCWAATKFDGQRTIILAREVNGQVFFDYRARSGKFMDHLPGLYEDDLRLIHKKYGDFVLDGESFASNFTETINAKKAGDDTAKANLRFRLFNFMPYKNWVSQSPFNTQGENIEVCLGMMEYLKGTREEGATPKVIFEPGKIVNDYAEMMGYCDYVIDQDGDEGLILKDLESSYTWERSFAWTKVKRFYDVDAKLIGMYPGKAKTRLANSLGGIVIAGYLEDGTLVVSRIGSGFSDAQRDELWNNQEKYLGQVVVAKYQEVTKAKGRDINSLRFVTFEHFRDDKDVDLTDEDIVRMEDMVQGLLKGK